MVSGLGAILTASAFFLSLALQRIDGRNPLETGLALLPMALAWQSRQWLPALCAMPVSPACH